MVYNLLALAASKFITLASEEDLNACILPSPSLFFLLFTQEFPYFCFVI